MGNGRKKPKLHPSRKPEIPNLGAAAEGNQAVGFTAGAKAAKWRRVQGALVSRQRGSEKAYVCESPALLRLQASLAYFRRDLRDELIQRFRAEVVLVAVADGAFLGFRPAWRRIKPEIFSDSNHGLRVPRFPDPCRFSSPADR